MDRTEFYLQCLRDRDAAMLAMAALVASIALVLWWLGVLRPAGEGDRRGAALIALLVGWFISIGVIWWLM